jgi:hypothetical protein
MMTATNRNPQGRTWTAAELRQLPAEQRDAILVQAAALAEVEYLRDASLSAFEAFGQEDRHGGSFDAEPR